MNKMKSLFYLFIILFSSIFIQSYSDTANIELTIEGITAVAETDKSFVCVTLDWWPITKCNYGWCPWGNSSAISLDLKNPILHNALKEFAASSPLRVRIGGSLQDQVIYKVGKHHPKCRNFKLEAKQLFNFSKGCLTMCRWKSLNKLFNATGSVVTFGLNALHGRKKVDNDILYKGNWDSSNARALIEHTASKGYNVDSWELGNELCGSGVSARVEAEQYGMDVRKLRSIIDEVYKHKEKKPKVVAPGGFYEKDWFADFFKSSGPNTVDVVTHHIYNLGPGDSKDLVGHMKDPFYLDQTAQTYNDIVDTVKFLSPSSSVWVGESGGAYNNGGPASGTFVDGFWYLDSLGMTSTLNHKAFCRQSLIGGNYALLDTKTFVPNPDYYSALLWNRLMGRRVLRVTQNDSPYLRAYAHCGRRQHTVTLLLINFSNSTSFDVSVNQDFNLHPSNNGQLALGISDSKGTRENYHLTPKDGNITSKVMLLNGKPLQLSNGAKIPTLTPLMSDAFDPIIVKPSSIAFVRYLNTTAPACHGNE